MLGAVSIDEGQRATIDGQNLTYDIVVAALSAGVSSQINSVKEVVAKALQIADGKAVDAALGLRWLGGADHDILGAARKKNGLEPTADFGLSDSSRAVSHASNAVRDLSVRGGAMGQHLDVQRHGPGEIDEVPSGARARVALYVRGRTAMTKQMGEPKNDARISVNTFSGPSLICPFWRESTCPPRDDENVKWAPQYRAAAETLALNHAAMEDVAVTYLRHIPMVARLQHVQLALGFLEDCRRLDALVAVEKLLEAGGSAPTAEELLTTYVQHSPPFAGAGKRVFQKTSAGWELHAAHEDANGATTATVHVTGTERKDGQATIFCTAVGTKMLVLPSIPHTVTAFIATGTHKTTIRAVGQVLRPPCGHTQSAARRCGALLAWTWAWAWARCARVPRPSRTPRTRRASR